jgi:hypothetical protein
MNTGDKLKVLREAGYVERCHTLPHVGSYNIAQHCYGALNILLLTHPKPSVSLIKAVMWHDAHERFLGDTPATALWADGEFARLYDRLGARIDRACGFEQKLTVADRMWLRAVDKMDLLFWAQEQLGMGNHNAAAVCGSLASWFSHNEIPLPCKEMIENYDIVRLPDELP